MTAAQGVEFYISHGTNFRDVYRKYLKMLQKITSQYGKNIIVGTGGLEK